MMGEALTIGAVLNDRYRLDAELGKGGMGMVYRAHDLLLDRPVAVKALADHDLGSAGRAHLLHEAQAVARLNHPNIVSIFDAGEWAREEDKRIPFIVMELIEGNSLFEHMPQSIDEVTRIARQICTALQHAHTHGIIHRDLKPENVIVTPTFQVKLTDFGLARSASSGVTPEGVITGTVYYLAPEVATHQALDERVDLYSLGVLLYEMVTGRLPFSGDDPLAVISQHIYAPVVPPRAYRKDLPPALDQLIVQLLGKQPADRPASAADVARRLEQLDRPGRLEAAPAGQDPYQLDRLVRGRLIGRQKELAEMDAAWQRARAGQGSCMLITGEPGIGKTRVVRELVTEVAVTGGRVLSGECYAEGSMPYGPFTRLIADSFTPGEMPLELPDYVLADLAALIPELRGRFMQVQPYQGSEPQADQQHLFESVVVWLSALAARMPVLLYIDDIHWADSGTLFLLRHLARRTRNLPVLMLLSYREIELDQTCCLQDVLMDFNRERLTTRIKLTRFDREQTWEFISVLLTPSGKFDDALLNAIYRETEGNPYYIEEVVKTLIEEQQLTYIDDRWVACDLENLVIPQSVRVTIQKRLSRLPEQTQEVLLMAAILGREFDFDTLQRMSELDEDILIQALETAVHAQIISEMPRGRGTAMTFSFMHALVPTTLRESIGGLRRQRLHRKAAQTIEAGRPAGSIHESQRFETLAYHYEKAGDVERALVYFTRAADRALALYANQEAERHYRSSLDLCQMESERGLLLVGLGEAVFRQGRYKEAMQTWQDALALFSQASDFNQVARLYARAARAAWFSGDPAAALAICQDGLTQISSRVDMETYESPGMASLLHETARSYYFMKQLDEVRELCSKALTMAEHLGMVEVQAEVYSTLGILSKQSKGEARHALQRAVELAESAGLLFTAIRAHTNVGENYSRTGEIRLARDHFRRSSQLAHQIGMPSLYHGQLGTLAELSIDLGDFDEVEKLLQEMEQVWPYLPDSEIPMFHFHAITARLQIFRGDWEQGLPTLLACLEESSQPSLARYGDFLLELAAQAYFEMGNYAEARKYLDAFYTRDMDETAQGEARFITLLLQLREGETEASQLTLVAMQSSLTDHSDIRTEVLTLWAEARLTAHLGDLDAAIQKYQQTLELIRQSELRWHQARIAVFLAEAYERRHNPGDTSRAHESLLEARTLFDQMKARFYTRLVEQKLNPVLL